MRDNLKLDGMGRLHDRAALVLLFGFLVKLFGAKAEVIGLGDKVVEFFPALEKLVHCVDLRADREIGAKRVFIPGLPALPWFRRGPFAPW